MTYETPGHPAPSSEFLAAIFRHNAEEKLRRQIPAFARALDPTARAIEHNQLAFLYEQERQFVISVSMAAVEVVDAMQTSGLRAERINILFDLDGTLGVPDDTIPNREETRNVTRPGLPILSAALRHQFGPRFRYGLLTSHTNTELQRSGLSKYFSADAISEAAGALGHQAGLFVSANQWEWEQNLGQPIDSEQLLSSSIQAVVPELTRDAPESIVLPDPTDGELIPITKSELSAGYSDLKLVRLHETMNNPRYAAEGFVVVDDTLFTPFLANERLRGVWRPSLLAF